MARHGGGAFSGKDPSKVDRSGAYAARWSRNTWSPPAPRNVAKSKSLTPSASRGRVGARRHVRDRTRGSHKIAKAVDALFDLRPAAIIRDLDLRRPLYQRTAAYGHFGRSDRASPGSRPHG